MGAIVGEVRRRVSVAAVKAQADCLLNRISSIGQGAVAAGKRRQWLVFVYWPSKGSTTKNQNHT